MVRNRSQHWMSLMRLTFVTVRTGSMKPPLRRETLCTLVCISSPRSFCCSCWGSVDKEYDEGNTSGDLPSPKTVHCDNLTDHLVEQFSLTSTYVNHDIDAKRVGQENTQTFSSHRPGHDESIFLVFPSIIDTPIWADVNAAIANLTERGRKIRGLWGYQEESDGDGGPHSRNCSSIFDSNTTARWAKAAMTLNNPSLQLSCIVSNKPTVWCPDTHA